MHTWALGVAAFAALMFLLDWLLSIIPSTAAKMALLSLGLFALTVAIILQLVGAGSVVVV